MMSKFQELIKGETPVLVDFYADWCGPCKTLAPILDTLKTDLGNKIKILKINVDKNPKAAAAYNVRGVPTLIFYHRGEIKWRKSGVIPLPELKKMVSI
ncbi:thioredoxin [Luteibaculum oceani]|uniref:Thioredoxin n=1 Tax=Luteibaculum oceani TaxID=1294296 RepID=A0A5C6VNP7_9FLAO|nr:thioredoxin [Luteibaculum oceani]TXC85245.1 thioredoxin [Luteibaculum oceani]